MDYGTLHPHVRLEAFNEMSQNTFKIHSSTRGSYIRKTRIIYGLRGNRVRSLYGWNAHTNTVQLLKLPPVSKPEGQQARPWLQSQDHKDHKETPFS